MKKEIINSKSAPVPIGPYSQGTVLNNLIFTSGQLPVDPDTGRMPETIEGQTKQSLENVKALLQSAGSDMDKVLKTTVFLSDINNFLKMNEVYACFFDNSYPARSAVEVARLPKDALIEIEAVAFI